jgi:hypothetical protein
MMGHRERLKGGDEYDYLTKARRHYGHPRNAAEIKRGFSKRVRRDAKADVDQELITLSDWADLDCDWSWHDVMYQEGDGFDE